MDKDDRFEELCRICGVAAARVDKAIWEKWKRYQDNREQEKNEEQHAPRVKPISGEVERFVVLEGKDPYKILGVSRYASHAEIKKAFRKMALESHPDKAGETGTETFKGVNTAHRLVSNSESRKEVDILLDTSQKGYERVAASQCG